jgi:hypothetical protein
MALDMNWLKKALEITGDFETSGNPWAGVTGDFDAMGISCGVLQWNIGMGSLQPLVINVGKPLVLAKMPNFGAQLWQACNSPVAQGLTIVRGWQVNKNLKPVPKAELQNLFGSEQMIGQQTQRAKSLGQNALTQATKWARDLRGATAAATLQEFCWFFDLLTQSGGLSGITAADVKNFITANNPANTDDVICSWLKNYPATVTVNGQQLTVAGRVDGKKNADLWRNNVSAAQLELFVLCFLRAQKSKAQYRPVVMNRRGTIAALKGFVNGELENLTF